VASVKPPLADFIAAGTTKLTNPLEPSLRVLTLKLTLLKKSDVEQKSEPDEVDSKPVRLPLDFEDSRTDAGDLI
jgi:hypothetical protein